MRKYVLLGLLVMGGCVISPLPVEKKEPPVIVSPALPAPVWPDACVADWYAKEKLPPCVESWITDITKQQKAIEKKRKIHKSKAKHTDPHQTQPNIGIK